MKIQIRSQDLGGTEFHASPHRLQLGARNAKGVDRLFFLLPERWKNCSVTLHIRHCDGSLAEPILLEANGSVPVGRNFTGWESGQWILQATDSTGYTAYTRPGSYSVHKILPTDGSGGEPSASLYEQFVSQTLTHAEQAANAAARAEAAADSLSRLLRSPASALVLSPCAVLCGPEELTPSGLQLTRKGSTLSLSGQGSTYAVWPLPDASSGQSYRITGRCTSLTGGMRIVLNGASRAYPDEDEYCPLAELSTAGDFDLTFTPAAAAADSDIDLTKPLDIRFLFTAPENTACLEEPTLFRKENVSAFVDPDGSTLGEVLRRIEEEIRKHHPAGQ